MFTYDDLIVECRGCGYECEAWKMLLYAGYYYCNVACKLEYAGLDAGEVKDGG